METFEGVHLRYIADTSFGPKGSADAGTFCMHLHNLVRILIESTPTENLLEACEIQTTLYSGHPAVVPMLSALWVTTIYYGDIQ